VNLVTTALRLPDMDGLDLARYLREHTPQAYIPIIVVSGDVQERLENRSFSDDVTDYFDKALGFGALAAFIKGYVAPESEPGGEVLYVEDSRVVAVATRRMLEKHGLTVIHATGVEDAIAHLETMKAQGRIPGPDVVLTDVYLKGDLTGKDLVHSIRNKFGYPKGQLPVLVMTGDANPANQTDLLRAGANDLVQKPIEERLLVTKLLFQLRVGRLLRQKMAK
jgi:CheY-like chemotaxis protein